MDGLRTQRTDGTKTYSYVYNGGTLSQMTVGSDTLTFTYDASGRPLALDYNGTDYYYVTNLQGDVTAILSASGTAVVTYTYDAWGNPLTTSGDLATTLGTLNPLRYRGYVYDTETELYYLQSRYYDPEVGRFINADVYASTGQGILGNNMFAYCNNNSVNCIDLLGYLPANATNDTFMVSFGIGEGNPYEATLGDYIYSTLPEKVKQKEARFSRIYNKTMDSGAASAIEAVDSLMFLSVGLAISGRIEISGGLILLEFAGGFLFGAVHGFVDAVQEEYGTLWKRGR